MQPEPYNDGGIDDSLDPCTYDNLVWNRANPATHDMPHYECKYPNGTPVFPDAGMGQMHTCLGNAPVLFGVPYADVNAYCSGFVPMNPVIEPLVPIPPIMTVVPYSPIVAPGTIQNGLVIFALIFLAAGAYSFSSGTTHTTP